MPCTLVGLGQLTLARLGLGRAGAKSLDKPFRMDDITRMRSLGRYIFLPGFSSTPGSPIRLSSYKRRNAMLNRSSSVTGRLLATTGTLARALRLLFIAALLAVALGTGPPPARSVQAAPGTTVSPEGLLTTPTARWTCPPASRGRWTCAGGK